MRFSPFVAAVAGLGAAAAARAGPTIILSPAVVSQYVEAQVAGQAGAATTSTALGPVGVSNQSPPGTIGAGAADATGDSAGTPKPMLGGAIDASVNGATIPPGYRYSSSIDNTAEYFGRLSYEMEILGPTASVAIQIKGSAAISTSPLASSTLIEADQEFAVYYTDDYGKNQQVLYDRDYIAAGAASSNISGSAATGYSGGFTETGVYQLQTDVVYSVGLQDLISLGVQAPGGAASISGSVDPTFHVAAGVTDPGDYSFVFSPGIGNGPAGGVPEPAAWAELLVGLFGLGSALRLRKPSGRTLLAV